MSSSSETIIVPRNFMLLEELEKAEKGKTDMSVSYGLVRPDDVEFKEGWQCTILGTMPPIESRIISLLLVTGKNYPKERPGIQFQTKLNYPWLNGDGTVNTKKMVNKELDNWPAHMYADGMGLQNCLLKLRAEMQHKNHSKVAQPPEGQTY